VKNFDRPSTILARSERASASATSAAHDPVRHAFLRPVIDERVSAKHLCGRLDWLKALIHFGTSIVAFEGHFKRSGEQRFGSPDRDKKCISAETRMCHTRFAAPLSASCGRVGARDGFRRVPGRRTSQLCVQEKFHRLWRPRYEISLGSFHAGSGSMISLSAGQTLIA
jgi:hypothetical protein